MDKISNKLNNRQLQAFAAVCLWTFCEKLHIKHEAIDKLIIYLLNIFVEKSLHEWERKGVDLEVSGRGNPLPAEISNLISVDLIDDFMTLVECVVQVGLTDMYAADTDDPKKFLEKSLEILQKNLVSIPSIDKLNQFGASSDSWGVAISQDEFGKFLNSYGMGWAAVEESNRG